VGAVDDDYQYDADAAIAKAAREDFSLQFIKQTRT
jgi:hypothetical protein